MCDYISRADAIDAVNMLDIFPPTKDAVARELMALPSAEAEPKWNCTANFVAEQLERLRNMTDEERWNFLIRFFSPSAEQVTSKLNNPCDSLLTDDKDGSKEQKNKLDLISRADAIDAIDDAIDADSPQWAILRTKIGFLPSAEAVTIEVTVPNAHKVGRVLVMDTDSHIGGGLFYPDDAVQGEWIEREDWNGDYYYDCSVCGESFVLCDGTPSMNLYNYCPNCGARMENKK